MSAVNIFTDTDRAVVLTDGATYEPDGTLVLIRKKCFVMDGLKSVVAGRGPFWFHEALARTLPKFAASIEDLALEGRGHIERCIEAAQGRELLDDDPALDVFLVGWSVELQGPMCLQYTTRAPDGIKPFSTVESVLAPSLPGDAEAAVLRAVGPMVTIDYDRVGVAIMEEQRRQQGVLFAPGQFLVGGHILRTDITAKGITQRMLHTWSEDKVNSKIRPAPRFDPLLAPNVTPMKAVGQNRKERRQIAFAQRRSAAGR